VLVYHLILKNVPGTGYLLVSSGGRIWRRQLNCLQEKELSSVAGQLTSIAHLYMYLSSNWE